MQVSSWSWLRAGFILALAGLLAVPASAQRPAGGERGGRQGGEQRQGRRGPGGGPGGARGIERMTERIAEQLELDEEQRAQLNEIAAQQRERMQEARELFREIMQAERDGDEARAEELRASLPEPPAEGWNPMTQVLDQLEPYLHEEQLDKLTELRENVRQRGPGGRIERLAEDLQLDETQRAQLDELSQGLREQFRGNGENRRQMRDLFLEMREAQDAGDEDRVEELQSQINELRPDRGAVLEQFYDSVEGILREDQIELLDGVRQRTQERFADFNARMRDGMGGGSGRAGRANRGTQGEAEVAPLEQFEEALDFGSTLELDPEQRAAFDKIMTEARRRQEAEELSGQELNRYVLKEMRGILREDQIESFGAYRAEVLQGQTRAQNANDVRLVFRALRKVNLTKQQSLQLRDIQKEATAKYKEVRRDKEKLAELAAGVQKQVLALLDEEQAEEFNKELQQQQRRETRRQGRARGR